MKCIYKFILSFLFLISSCSSEKEILISGLNLLPSDSSIIININDINRTREILNENLLVNAIYPASKSITKHLDILVNDKIKKGILSISPYGKDDLAYTFISEVDVNDSLFNDLNNLQKYQNINIYSNDNKNIYIASLENYYVSSNRDLIIENIIRDFNSKNYNVDSELLKISKTILNNEPFNIFLKSKESKETKDIFKNLAFFPNADTSWIGYDFKNSLSEINLNGASRINDSINSKLSILKDIYPIEIKTDKIIPNSFISFISIAIGDYERFIFNMKNYLNSNNISAYNLNFKSLSIIEEISFVEDQEKFIVLGIKNLELINNYFDLSNTEYENIKQINFKDNFEQLINYLDYNSNIKYTSLIDNFLVLTNSISQLRKINNSININDVLGSNSDYLKYKKSNSSKYNFYWVANSLNSIDDTIIKDYELSEYPYISLSGTLNQNIALFNFDFSKVNKRLENGNIYTEFLISSNDEIISDPIWLKNHIDKGYDFAFQDSNNYLNYYSNKGDLLWKKSLSGRIIGEIKQIDIYKNGRLQILFRTSDRLYLIDRNGNEVSQLSFDIKNGKINHPISVFDYDKNRNYRILVTTDNQIQMYDNSGKIVKGFDTDNFKSDIINSPVHIRIDDKDYIVLQLRNGELKILNRRGKDRVVVDEKIQFSNNSVFSFLKLFTTTDDQGNLIQVDSQGNLTRDNRNLSKDNLINIYNNNLIYLNKEELSINGISIKLNIGRYSRPKLFNLNGSLYVGITDLNEGNLYLFKNNAELVEGFPIKGTSSFDLIDSDNDGKLEIISRLDKFSIVSYEIN